jgi:hypothetical protein
MRVTIIGKTASTIAFNTIGIVLRGQTSAVHIDIKNDDQKRELIGLKNAGLINVISEDVIPDVKQVVVLKPIVVEEIKKQMDAERQPAESVESVEPVEDAPSSKQDAPIKRQRGRPKGTTKNKPVEAQKKLSAESKSILPPTIKRIESKDSIVSNKEQPSKTDVIVMTTSGPVKTTAPRTMSPEIVDSDLTMASINALKELEDEERNQPSEDFFIDESKLDRSERMGEKATIVMGSNKTLSVSMKNSTLPEAEAIKLVELKAKQTLENEDKKANDAFIDQITEPESIKDNDNSDFLEI